MQQFMSQFALDMVDPVLKDNEGMVIAGRREAFDENACLQKASNKSCAS